MSEEKAAIKTLKKLHEGKLGAHWIWCALQQIANGQDEVEVLRDFGYSLSSTPDSSGEGEPVARAFVDGNYAVRELRWMPDMPSFDLPVGTKLYTRPTPPAQQLGEAPHPVGSALTDMEARKDAAYLERNQVVAALATAFPSGIARTAIEGWSEDWHGCVYIDLPTGQASWHFHDSHAYLFAALPPYAGEWDGHTTEQKYERLAALAAVPQSQPPAPEKCPTCNDNGLIGGPSFYDPGEGGVPCPDCTPKLPHDVSVGGNTFRKGVSLETFISAAQGWHRAAYPNAYNLTAEQKAANLRRLMDAATPPALASEPPAATQAVSDCQYAKDVGMSPEHRCAVKCQYAFIPTPLETKPFAYYVYIAAEQRGEFVHDLDDACDDLTNCECEVTPLYEATAGASTILATPGSEPTDEQWYDIASRHACSNWSGNDYLELIKSVGKEAILAATQAPAVSVPPAASEPAGWKLVPIEPTREMIDAGYMHTMRADEEEPYRARGEAIACYADMLVAAPSQQPATAEDEHPTAEEWWTGKPAVAVQAELVGYVNGDELANMLGDRVATIQGKRSGWRSTELYTLEQVAEIELAAVLRGRATGRKEAARPKPAAHEGEREAEAWLFKCKRPGTSMVYASVDENDTNHWPLDQWKSVEKFPLVIAAQSPQQPTKAAPATGEEVVSDEALGEQAQRFGAHLTLVKSADGPLQLQRIEFKPEQLRKFLALRSGASAQPADGSKS